MTNNEIHSVMEKLDKKLDGLKEEVHSINIRLVKLETVFKLAFWAVSASGLIGTILGIIHIFKALTN